MGVFDLLKKNTPLQTLKPTDQPDKFNGSFFYPLFATAAINWGANQFLKDFLEIPELNAIIGIKVNAFANMKLKVVSKQTGSEVSNSEPIVRALRNPNFFQSQKEFISQTKFFHEIYGNEYLFFLTPIGMPNNVKGLYTINPATVKIRINSKTPYFLLTDENATYLYHYDGVWNEFASGDITHINRASVNFADNSFNQEFDSIRNHCYLSGVSPQTSLQAPLRNIRAAYEARNVLIENRGALGILSNNGQDSVGALPLDPTDKKELQEEFKRYGMTKSQWQVIITGLNLKWQQMSIDADKLRLFEECEKDTRAICNQYGVPYELLAENQTYENKLRAERQMYQDTIIPEAEEWVGALNRRFETAEKSWMITVSYDHLPVFQENMKERAISLKQTVDALVAAQSAGYITADQAKKELSKFGI